MPDQQLPDMNRPGWNGETGIFLKGAELERARDLIELAVHTPVVVLIPGDIDEATRAWLRAKEHVTDCAVRAGLPVIAGYYGLNPQTGEILS